MFTNIKAAHSINEDLYPRVCKIMHVCRYMGEKHDYGQTNVCIQWCSIIALRTHEISQELSYWVSFILSKMLLNRLIFRAHCVVIGIHFLMINIFTIHILSKKYWSNIFAVCCTKYWNFHKLLEISVLSCPVTLERKIQRLIMELC